MGQQVNYPDMLRRLEEFGFRVGLWVPNEILEITDNQGEKYTLTFKLWLLFDSMLQKYEAMEQLVIKNLKGDEN